MLSVFAQTDLELAGLEVPKIRGNYLTDTGEEIHVVRVSSQRDALVVFGRMDLGKWLLLVNQVYVEQGETPPYNPDDPDSVVECLDQAHYTRVNYSFNEENEGEVVIDWHGEDGLTPITFWVLDFVI